MAIPATSRECMVHAIQRFRAGDRSPQGPDPAADWLRDTRYDAVIIHDDEPYPVTEIIRLAVRDATGTWLPRLWGGEQANQYAAHYGFTVMPKIAWRRASPVH